MISDDESPQPAITTTRTSRKVPDLLESSNEVEDADGRAEDEIKSETDSPLTPLPEDYPVGLMSWILWRHLLIFRSGVAGRRYSTNQCGHSALFSDCPGGRSSTCNLRKSGSDFKKFLSSES